MKRFKNIDTIIRMFDTLVRSIEAKLDNNFLYKNNISLSYTTPYGLDRIISHGEIR